MTRRKAERLTVYTSTGSGSYRSRSKALAAARWVAGESGETVVVTNEVTGQRWDVSPSTTAHSLLPV
jgi:hypothetical protein